MSTLQMFLLFSSLLSHTSFHLSMTVVGSAADPLTINRSCFIEFVAFSCVSLSIPELIYKLNHPSPRLSFSFLPFRPFSLFLLPNFICCWVFIPSNSFINFEYIVGTAMNKVRGRRAGFLNLQEEEKKKRREKQMRKLLSPSTLLPFSFSPSPSLLSPLLPHTCSTPSRHRISSSFHTWRHSTVRTSPRSLHRARDVTVTPKEG